MSKKPSARATLGLPRLHTKKVRIPVVFTSLPRHRAIVDQAHESLRWWCLCHVTYDAVGPPPLSTRVLSHDWVTRSLDRSPDRADRVFSLLRVPPPPGLPVYGGAGVSVGPAVCLSKEKVNTDLNWFLIDKHHGSHSQNKALQILLIESLQNMFLLVTYVFTAWIPYTK